MNTNPSEIKINPWLIAMSVMLATFMEVLDTSIANVALKHIAGSLSVSTDESTWVLTTYLISNAIVIPTTAWFGRRFGRKNFLMVCVGIFTAASFLCGISTSLPMLLAMRILQGAGGGALQPIAQSILLESFPKEKHGQAMGVYGLGVVIAPILGPVLGGWITDNYSWRWIFLINVPVGIMAMLLMKRFIHDPDWIRNAVRIRLDVIGFGFMSLWLGCQEVLLDKGQEDDWFGSQFILIMTVFAVVGLAVFVWRSLTAEKPFVDLRVMKSYNFSLSLALMFASGIALYGLTAIIPLFLQSLMGYTALQSGYTMIPRGLGALIAMPLAGRLVTKVKGRYLVGGGFLLYGASAFAMTRLTLDITPWILFWPLFISGVAIGFTFVPLNTLGLGALDPEQVGNGSGIFNLMRNVGGSLGISMVTTLVARYAQAHQNHLVSHLTPFDAAYRSTLQSMAKVFSAHSDAVTGQHQALVEIYRAVVTQANTLAYLDIFSAFSGLCIVCFVASLLLKTVKVTHAISAH